MKIPKKILDRRRSIRIEETLSFKIGHQSYELEAKTLNISAHGVLCLVDKDIPLMTQLRVALAIPGTSSASSTARRIQTKGVIVRKEKHNLSGKFLVAIYFSDIKGSSQNILLRFIEKRLASSSRP